METRLELAGLILVTDGIAGLRDLPIIHLAELLFLLTHNFVDFNLAKKWYFSKQPHEKSL
ncbi:MAG: hypothetical protein LAP21_19550 [Acidobacteriia bacterium]|nr:hypothetical protein [Terriglobia bacterium]